MTEPTVYLAGPVQNVEDSGRGWRDDLKGLYGDRWDFLDPLDKYDVAAEDLTIVDDGPAGEGEITQAELVETDKAFVDEADAVFVGWSVVPSVGTPMEMLYAYERDTPVGVWYDGGDELSPWMCYHADVIHDQPEIVLLQLTEGLADESGDRTPTHCPHCGFDGGFDGQGTIRRSYERTRSGVTSDVEEQWFVYHCPECDERSAMLEATDTEVVDRARF